MKIAILGGGGVRTPLILRAMAERGTRLGLQEVALMDVDGERLELIGALTAPLEADPTTPFRVRRTTNARQAMDGADFVITTFRVGGIQARVHDERIPLRHHVLGQETTGPGGFAMALRSIPVLLRYVEIMRAVCPRAWLINFANPAGLLAESAVRVGGWERTVGICDAPAQMQHVAAALLGVPAQDLYLDYFGLNHLGWIRAAICAGQDVLPRMIALLRAAGKPLPGLPFAGELIAGLGMIPNEYLYYYYSSREAVEHILAAGRTRGEQIAAENAGLFAELRRLRQAGDQAGMAAAYERYLRQRQATYMGGETGGLHAAPGEESGGMAAADGSQGQPTGGDASAARYQADRTGYEAPTGGNQAPPTGRDAGTAGKQALADFGVALTQAQTAGGDTGSAGDQALAAFSAALAQAESAGGYAGVALDLLESLAGGGPRQMILNVPNQGAIDGMDPKDVVEVPVYVAHDLSRPLAAGRVPDHCLSLMKAVKTYERLTIAAATEGSYAKAVEALTVHPLVRDHALARTILQEYQAAHGDLFPVLR